MPSDNYPYAVGRIKLIENALLGQGRLSRLEELSYSEALKQLNDWGFAAEYPDRANADGLIAWREKEIKDAVDDVTPDKPLTDLFFCEADATNLKLFFKSRLLGGMGLEERRYERGIFEPSLLKECVDGSDYSPLGEPLNSLLSKVEERLTLTSDPGALSSAVDAAVYACVLSRLNKRKYSFCLDYFKTRIDFTNVLSVLRANALGFSEYRVKDALIEGGHIPLDTMSALSGADRDAVVKALSSERCGTAVKTALSFGDLSRAADSFRRALLSLSEEQRYDSFGIGPIVYYLLLGQYECGRLRAMFAEKQFNRA